MSKVIVVGGGACGLTTAIALSEAGHEVSVIAQDFLAGTTSWVATAIWHLLWVETDERVEGWSVSALNELIKLAADTKTGVTLVRGIECIRDNTPEADDFRTGRTGALWKHVVPFYSPLTRVELISRLPSDYPTDTLLGGYVIEVPIADMSVYLPYLMARMDDLHVPRTKLFVDSFEQIRESYPADWYVNCTGLGSRELVNDWTLEPIKGQVVRVARDGSVKEYIADDFSPWGMTYILPRVSDVILGGSQDRELVDSSVDRVLADKILDRCRALVPALADAEVLEHLAGFRPYRPSIRLEVDHDEGDVIHNYGHGGSGVSLSWGCAAAVVDLVETSTRRPAGSGDGLRV